MGKVMIQEIAQILISKNGLQKNSATDFVNKMFEVIREALDRDKVVKVKGLGTFKIIDVDSRESVNVNTGERVLIEGHNKITFIPDTLMKELVNKPFSQFETVVLNEGVDFVDEKEQPAASEDQNAMHDPSQMPLVDFASEEKVVSEEKGTISDEDIPEWVIEPEVAPVILEEEVALEEPQVEDVLEDSQIEDVPEETIEEQPQEVLQEEMIEEDVLVDPVEKIQEEPVEEEPIVEEEPREEFFTEVISDPEPIPEHEPEPIPVPEPGSEPEPEQEFASASEQESEDDQPEETEEELAEETGTERNRGWLIPLVACLLGLLVGYVAGNYLPFRGRSAATVILSDEVPESVQKAEKPVEQPIVKEDAQPVAEQPVAEQPVAEQPVVEQSEKEEAAAPKVQYDKYEQMDGRVRTGAYRIVGTDYIEKVRPGDDLARISRRTLGKDMECYIEVYNGLTRASELKTGQEIKIPKLEWKKKKKVQK